MSYVKGSQLPSTSTVADTDTLIVTQEGDSKATKKVAKSDLLKEDRTRLTNLETDNTTNKSNITNLQKSLENKAEKTHNHDSVYVKQDGSTPITGPLQLNQGSYVLQTTKVDGTYVFVAEIKIWSTYQNRPIKFEIVTRGHKSDCTCYIQFKNHWTNDPDIESFGYTSFSTDYSLYLIKTATSTWNLYIKKTEDYDSISITDFSNTNTNTTITWKNEGVSTLPEGGIFASPLSQDDKNITTLFERNNGTINKNINTCFNSSDGNFTAPEAGQYLIMCSGYELSSSSSEYVACVLDSSSSNQNKLYTTGSSGFTLITLNEGQTLAIYTATAGNINSTCISSNSTVNMLIARIK